MHPRTFIRLAAILAPLALHAADTDADGLSDDWEVFHSGNIATASQTSDFDRDGTTDLAEDIAGTPPVNPAENFRATISRNGSQLHASVTERAPDTQG